MILFSEFVRADIRSPPAGQALLSPLNKAVQEHWLHMENVGCGFLLFLARGSAVVKKNWKNVNRSKHMFPWKGVALLVGPPTYVQA